MLYTDVIIQILFISGIELACPVFTFKMNFFHGQFFIYRDFYIVSDFFRIIIQFKGIIQIEVPTFFRSLYSMLVFGGNMTL